MTLPLTQPQPWHDQARRLRELIERQAATADTAASSTCRTIAVVGGKGGVGKSVLAVNLAVTLAQQGRSVCLLDANFGLGSLDLMCGLNGYWNVSHVISGARRLAEIVLPGPEGIHLIPGASALADLADCPAPTRQHLLEEFAELERQHDVMIIDSGSGMHRLVRQIASSVDQLVVVTTPEPTAITDTYATIKSLSTAGLSFGLIVNFMESVEMAMKISDRLKHTAQMFVQADVEVLGFIPRDTAIPQSIVYRKPVVTFMPSSPAARAITRVANRCVAPGMNRPTSDTFFHRLSGTMKRPSGA